jgi:hypothetical protein
MTAGHGIAIIMTGFPLSKGGHDDRTGRKKSVIP